MKTGRLFHEELMKRGDLRNIALIAPVDHGKTTIVDGLLEESGILRLNEILQERVMDSIALKRERGTTIMSMKRGTLLTTSVNSTEESDKST